MKQEGLSYSYRNLALAAIKHYHGMHDILLNWRKIAKFLGERKFDNDLRAYTREEIQKLLDVASVKYKAIILLYASTGMRREALIDIKLSDMEYLHDYQIYKIKIYKKTPHEQLCLTTPECAKAINLYIENNDVGEYFHRVAPNTLCTKLRELALDASVANQQMTGNKRGQFRDHIPCIHGLRKFAITEMARAKIDTEIAKLLTGHSTLSDGKPFIQLALFCLIESIKKNPDKYSRHYSPIIDVISPLVVTLDGLPDLLSTGIVIVYL